MIDAGAEINLIKSNVLRKSTETDATETVQLTGISQDRHSTLGTAKVRIFGEDVKFQLVEENFPIQSNGILGTEFLQSKSATIDYTSGCLKFREKLPPGVYAGEALVKNENGKAYFKVINTTSKPVSLAIQRLELFDYSLGTLPNSAPNNSDPLSEICDPDQSEYLHYVHTIFATTSANETPKRENEDYDLDETADGTDDLDVTLPSTADAKITETDNEYSDVESASDSADYDKLFSPYTPTRVDMRSRMITENIFETRDSLHLRQDNWIVFTDLSGTPCDDSAKLLNKAKRLPKPEHLVLARAGVTNIGKYKLVIIPIKEQAENSTKFETLVEAIGALLSVTRELGLKSVSISKTNNIDGIPWSHVQRKLQNTFESKICKIVVCLNEILIPEQENRDDILAECHSSAIGGHKGVTKTYNRIRQKYHWPNMKKDIQEYIRNFEGCQLKKLVRIKSKAPMILTDTPGAAFDKIAMDIVGPLPETKKGNKYILTIQDSLTKFFVAVALKTEERTWWAQK
ncbi:hypothetical protein M0804_015104 [Polistes exclamans]|nr:hypothetical protein M0804_015104 [Polistes exclamans]